MAVLGDGDYYETPERKRDGPQLVFQRHYSLEVCVVKLAITDIRCVKLNLNTKLSKLSDKQRE